jgi:hypothetical protein
MSRQVQQMMLQQMMLQQTMLLQTMLLQKMLQQKTLLGMLQKRVKQVLEERKIMLQRVTLTTVQAAGKTERRVQRLKKVQKQKKHQLAVRME